MKIIKWFYYLFPNYEVYEVYRGKWMMNDTIIWSIVVYEIMYSKRLNKYKLKIIGTDGKKHPVYPQVIIRLNELNKTV